MKSVLLRLEGPLQSWGTQSRFEIRDTDAEPSKSGVLGMVGAALGMKRTDGVLLRRLRQLAMAVRVDRPGAIMRDYHTVGGGRAKPKRGEKRHLKGTVLTERLYLADASFVVALGGTDSVLVERIASAVGDPRWPLFLGRRSCPPSVPIGSIAPRVVEATPAEAIVGVVLGVRRGDKAPPKIRMVVEADAANGDARMDVPLSFELYERRFEQRWVRSQWIDTTALTLNGPPSKDA